MTEYWFKLKVGWDNGTDTIASKTCNFSSEKQARAYAIKLLESHKCPPSRSCVEIRKTIKNTYKTTSVGDVTSYKSLDGKRTFGYITYEMLTKGIHNRPLNHDGSFKSPVKKIETHPFGL